MTELCLEAESFRTWTLVKGWPRAGGREPGIWRSSLELQFQSSEIQQQIPCPVTAEEVGDGWKVRHYIGIHQGHRCSFSVGPPDGDLRSTNPLDDV